MEGVKKVLSEMRAYIDTFTIYKRNLYIKKSALPNWQRRGELCMGLATERDK